MSNVIISIVSYCQRALLDRCLSYLNKHTLPPTWQIVVVDNNSSDDSLDMIKKHYSWVKLIHLTENIGFAGGHNVAYAQTESEFFFVLNPDVIVLPGSIETIVDMLKKFPQAAIVGPCLLNPDGSTQFSARCFYTWRTVVCRRFLIPWRKKVIDHHLMKNCDLTKILDVDWVLGAAMGIRRSAFPSKELFDTRYKLYFEDVDLCYFARKRGWAVLYCPLSKMIHDHQRTSAKKFFGYANINHFVSWIKFYLKSKRQLNLVETDRQPINVIS
jgi:GT2 family glycosyltransferase